MTTPRNSERRLIRRKVIAAIWLIFLAGAFLSLLAGSWRDGFLALGAIAGLSGFVIGITLSALWAFAVLAGYGKDEP